MNKNQVMKQAYFKPEIKVFKMQTEFSLLAGSKLNGGHNQGEIGDASGDAKKGEFVDDENWVSNDFSLKD